VGALWRRAQFLRIYCIIYMQSTYTAQNCIHVSIILNYYSNKWVLYMMYIHETISYILLALMYLYVLMYHETITMLCHSEKSPLKNS